MVFPLKSECASVFFLGQETHHRYEEDHLQHVDHVREVENFLGNFPIDRKSQKLEVPGRVRRLPCSVLGLYIYIRQGYS